MKDISKRILALRKSKKLTQAEFGKLFGVTHAHISSIERGRVKPSEVLVLFIIEKLNVNEIWLRTGEGQMYSTPNFDTITDSGKNSRKGDNMRQRIVIETEGLVPPLDDLSNIVRGVVVNTVLRYRMDEIQDFSIRREILPEETDGEIRVPEFLNMDGVMEQLRDGAEDTAPGKEVQDG